MKIIIEIDNKNTVLKAYPNLIFVKSGDGIDVEFCFDRGVLALKDGAVTDYVPLKIIKDVRWN